MLHKLSAHPAADLLCHYRGVRRRSRRIVDPLSPEDTVIQSMPDVSPTRWHLAHVTWFFETFLLKDRPGYRPFNEAFEYLFNSYYNTVGRPYPRDRRGLLSRPGLDEVLRYRDEVDATIERLIQDDALSPAQCDVLRIGLHHEQQHQELMLTDIKHVLSCNPLLPVYQPLDRSPCPATDPSPLTSSDDVNDWISVAGGVHPIGHRGDGFAFDNEGPLHNVYVDDFRIAARCVDNARYAQFIDDGGYREPSHWLSTGWSWVQSQSVTAPLYWRRCDDRWCEFTLHGLVPIDPHAAVSHVNYFEADAFARWSGHRLCTEAEWEIARRERTTATGHAHDEVTVDHQRWRLHPAASMDDWDDQVWQWTRSDYNAYPGYRPVAGALGEYNGKFMCGQYVLRGGSCVTPPGHTRPTYRNFFPPTASWQFTGIRLAE